MKTNHFIVGTFALIVSGFLFTAPASANHDAHSAHAGVNAASQDELKAQVDRSERAFGATMKNREYAALGQHLAEDAIVFAEDGVLYGREAILKAWQKYYEGAGPVLVGAGPGGDIPVWEAGL